jgi:hypothetical protein
MTAAAELYSPTYEVVIAWFLGILGFMMCFIVIWAFYSGATDDVGLGSLATLFSDGALSAFGKGVRAIPTVTTVFIFFAVAMLIASLPQLLVLAFPLVLYMSKGIEDDAKRGWIFYILAGAMIGGVPWIVLEHFAIGPGRDFESRAIFIVPALTSGILAGAILKLRLTKMARLLGGARALPR